MGQTAMILLLLVTLSGRRSPPTTVGYRYLDGAAAGRAGMNMRARAGKGLAALLTVVVLSAGGMSRAQAVDPGTAITIITTAAKVAYEAYQKYGANQLTLEQATAQIISAVNAAKTQIIAEIDQVAAADVKACATAAIIDLEDIRTFTADTLQAYARDATLCLTRAEALIGAASDKGAIDQLGFTLNAVGPVALLARTRAGFSTGTTRSVLISGNNSLIAKLYPSCQANPLYGDAPPGGLVEVMLRCRAYNGDTGFDTAFSRTPRTIRYTFTDAANQATRNTSRALARAVLPRL
jgi:hypothetical protein